MDVELRELEVGLDDETEPITRESCPLFNHRTEEQVCPPTERRGTPPREPSLQQNDFPSTARRSTSRGPRGGSRLRKDESLLAGHYRHEKAQNSSEVEPEMVRTLTSGVRRMMEADLAGDYKAVPKALPTPALQRNLDTLTSKNASKRLKLAESEAAITKAANKLYQDRAELCRGIRDEAAAVKHLRRQKARELEDAKRRHAQAEADIRAMTASAYVD